MERSDVAPSLTQILAGYQLGSGVLVHCAPQLGILAEAREIKRYAGALGRRAVDRQPAVVALDQRIDDAETKPGAAKFPGKPAVGLVEGAHDQLGHLGADADPLIGDAEPRDSLAFAADRDVYSGAEGTEFRGVRQHL